MNKNNFLDITKLLITIASAIFLMIQQLAPLPYFLNSAWASVIIATIVQFWSVSHFYKRAWNGVINRNANMYTLIILATLIAYIYSIGVLIFQKYFSMAGVPTHIYFETSVMILAFIVLGDYLEKRATRYTSQAIEQLIQLQPNYATVLRIVDNKKQWVEIPIEQVKLDEIIRIDPGSQIPVDGIIISGSSSINESMVTGESKSVTKQKNDPVIAGTINLTNSFEIKAQKIGSETMLAKIIDLVEKAQQSRPPIQRLVDTVASYFVPIVILCSLITFLIWFNFGPEPYFSHALYSMISVLIIACPCALGLATPISIIVATGQAAKAGILVKDVIALEKANKLNCIVFDKTGTLTLGKPSIIDFKWVNDLQQKKYLNLIKAVQERSKHPISQAIILYLKEKYHDIETLDLAVKEFTSIPGYGIQASIEGETVLIGSQRLLEKHNITLSENVLSLSNQWQHEGKTVSFIAIDNALIAYYSAMDTLRESALPAMQQLNTMNISTILLTGDNPKIAQIIAKKLGITNFFAQVLPAEKAEKIKQLKAQYIIGMVGDGINDAPALASADVGIAMGSGTDIAFETAQMALLHNDLLLIPFAITLSQATINNIRQNLIWAFGYNILLIPVAMGILYPLFKITINPMLAGAAMALSSLSVVLNALRLKRLSLKELSTSYKAINNK